MKPRLVLAWALLLACIATASGAADKVVPTDAATQERLFDAKFLLGREQYAEAAAIYRELIARDAPEAMWQLGAMLQAGMLGAPDEHEGRALFQRAAAAGGRYQCEVGAMVFFGVDGFARDPEEGRRLIQDAIQGGYVDGYHHLAMLEEDPAARARTLREGADRGSAECRLALGFAYLDGRGVPADRDAGVKYLSLAADADPAFLSRALSGLIDAGGVEPETLLRLAEKLEQHCLAAGDPDLAPAFLELSHLFRNGIVFDQDDEKADFWLEQAKSFGDNALLAALAERNGPAPDSDSRHTTAVIVADEDAREKIGEQVARERDAAIAAFNRSDYDAAFAMFSELYDADDPEVYAYLGRCFEGGLGTGKDYEEAVYWSRLAADRNNPMGLNSLGVYHDHGYGVEKDHAEAMRYFKLAADQGYAIAMANLGIHYENGYATAVNLAEAARLYRLAAEAGVPSGQYNYARALLEGRGVAVNDAEAFSLFNKAAEAGNTLSYFYLGLTHATGRGVPQDYSKAAEWYRKAAEAGNISAQNNLGVLYLNGWGVPRDPVEAARWYRKAAEGGDTNARSNLGGMLYDGTAGYTDYAEAFKWTLAGAEGGNAEAMHRLGHMYYESKGAAYNYEEARRWFRQAREKGRAGCDTSRALIGH